MKRKRRKQPHQTKPQAGPTEASQDLCSKFTPERKFEIVVLLLLTVFGVYKAIALWGAFAVPAPDFSTFIRVGEELLSFDLPSSFKRAPVVGVLQVLISKAMGGDVLRAAWLLNAVLSVGNGLLFWLIGKRFVGKTAFFFSLVAVMGPYVLKSQVNPIAETAMIFFTALTLWLILKETSWAYAAASAAALVRYECAALIFIVFVYDCIRVKTWHGRGMTLLKAFLASIPFLLWMLGTHLNWDSETTHYLGHYRGDGRNGLQFFVKFWNCAFVSLAALPGSVAAMFGVTQEQADRIQGARQLLWTCNKWIVVITFFAAVVEMIRKRNRQMLCLILFVCLYSAAHALKRGTIERYAVPLAWITLLCCWYGACSLWALLPADRRWSSVVKTAVMLILLVLGILWTAQLFPYLQKIQPYYKKGAWLSHVALITIGIGVVGYLRAFRTKGFLVFLCAASISSVMICSSHFSSARQIGNGDYYIELKYILDWYEKNAGPGEKLASRFSVLMGYMSPQAKPYLVNTKTLKSDSMRGFIDNCYANNITYITYCTRGGKGTRKGLENITPVLAKPKSNGPLIYIGQIKLSPKRFVNFFKLAQRANAEIHQKE